ncbi:hypothetical protein SOCEGT47_007410 [Sorangium cellulosum]|jgi:hypothetical protein|uniref:Uncharacterized protein n=1 Tax=Sorangium cellulosum TaxID=56 RepID=A0A4P2PU49_SORCE|nr:hypothetical protein [Sorangium cellulosum]AUX20275.1 hypothetical protein SOCEGT47_007410 [Sorangium cellulosum]
MGLSEALNDASKKPQVVADCCKLVDEEVASKSGLSGLAVKAGYAAVKGIKPGFIAQVVEKLLPEFAQKLDPIWSEATRSGNPNAHLISNRSQVADALLSVTDEKAKSSSSGVVRGTYEKLRGSAKKNVEDAVPRLAQLIQKHAS